MDGQVDGVGIWHKKKIDIRGRLNTKIYDKRDDFDFPIVNFSFLSGNISEAPAYGVYISQLIRYSRACDIYLIESDS